MDRRARLLDDCPVATGLGLEFGPLANPVVRKADGRVIDVDDRFPVALGNLGHGETA